MRKLALYFLSAGEASRVLDAEHQPIHGNLQGWIVGRSPISDICFKNELVSKKHALISASIEPDSTEGGSPVYRWELCDLISTNGTYLTQERGSPYRCAPSVPYAIKDRDVIQFGAQKASVRASFDIDDTLSPDYEPSAIPDTGGTAEAAPEVTPKAAAEATGRTLADVAAIVLNGPPGMDKRVWWLLLSALAGLYIYLVHN